MYRPWVFAAAALFTLLSSSAALAERTTDAGIAAVVLLDSSGSMKRTDPQRLRVPAAQLFLSLLNGDDRAGVVSFSDNGYPVVHMTASDATGRERLIAGTEKASSKGAYTNLYAALAKGMELLGETDHPVRGRYLILLSDGRMDTGDKAEDGRLTEQLRTALLPKLRERDIHVYSIAFTGASDTDLLREIALDSGGVYQLIEDQAQLHDAFADIFENAKTPNMLPMADNTFEVDGAVKELTVVAAHEQDHGVTMIGPTQEAWRYKEHPATVRWMHSPRFDLITVKDPAPGTWRLDTGKPDNRAYIVTDLELATDLQQTRLQRGETLHLRAWLTDQGEPLRKAEVLASTEFVLELEYADGTQRTVALGAPGEDGIATAAVPVAQAGPLRVSVLARTSTFERQTRHRVEVVDEPAETAAPVPQFVVPPIALPVPTQPLEPPATQSKQLPAAATPEPAAAEAPPTDASAADTEQPLSFTTVLLGFLLVNGVLALLVGIALVIRRRRRATTAAQEPPTED